MLTGKMSVIDSSWWKGFWCELASSLGYGELELGCGWATDMVNHRAVVTKKFASRHFSEHPLGTADAKSRLSRW